MAYTPYIVASDMASYLWKQDEARRKIVTFSTDIQGLIPQFLDKITIAHNALQWSTPREFIVIAIKPSGDTVAIDCVNYDPTIYN